MLHRLLLGLAVWLTVSLPDRLRHARRQPDTGMETADKILWAAVITVAVGAVGAVFKDKLVTFATNLTLSLGF